MKVLTVITIMLASHANASYLYDFKEAMSSVENAFGRLLSDVVTDVRSTMHCTILAVEQVLAMHGVISEPTISNDCSNDDDDDSDSVRTEEDNRSPYSVKDIAQDIHSSISKVNETLTKVLDDGHEKLNDIKKVLKDESMRLAEVSRLLRQELEKISHRMKKEVQNIHLNLDKSSVESVSNDVKELYELERSDKNISEVNEIGKVFNEAVSVLNIDTVSETSSDENKMKAIINKLELESSNTAGATNTNLEPSQSQSEQAVLQDNFVKQQVSRDTSRLDEVSENLFGYNDKIRKNIGDYIINKSSSAEDNNLINDKTQSVFDAAKSYNEGSSAYSVFGETSNVDTVKTINEAVNIIQNTAQTQTQLDNFFSKENGVNAFDNADLLEQ